MKVVSEFDCSLVPAGARIGFVPTMGALHDGHIHLLEVARKECDFLVLSIYVNPLQFGPNEDLDRYPRPRENDHLLASKVPVDVIFEPLVSDYTSQMSTQITVGGLSTIWEGESRPGHFDGVATIVCKLFHSIQPHVAFFGWKDYQQCQVIQKMVRDLNFPVELRFVETVREADGLALSSRNVYLSPQNREIAPLLYSQLVWMKEEAEKLPDDTDPRQLESAATEFLEEAGFAVDYIAIVQPHTMERIDRCTGKAQIIAAAKLGNTRLIDNLRIDFA